MRNSFAEARQLLALGGRQSGLAHGAIRLGRLDPAIQSRARQIEVARHTGDRLPFLENGVCCQLGTSYLFQKMPTETEQLQRSIAPQTVSTSP